MSTILADRLKLEFFARGLRTSPRLIDWTRVECSIPSGAEATFAAFGVGGEFVDRRKRDVFNGLNYKLGNPFASHNLEVLGCIKVDEKHLQLAAVSAVDEPRSVQDGDAMLVGHPAARLDQSAVSDGDGNGGTRWNERTTATGGQRRRLTGTKVDPRVAGTRICRQREIGVELDDR